MLRKLFILRGNDSIEVRREIDAETIVRLRRNQLYGGLATLVNPVSVTLGFWKDELAVPLSLWCIVGLLFAAIQIYSWYTTRNLPRPRHLSDKTMVKAGLLAMIGGLYWSSVIILTLPVLPIEEEMVVIFAAFGTSMVAAALMVSAPCAAMLFFLSTLIPSVVGIMIYLPEISTPLLALSIPYTAFILGMIYLGARDFQYMVRSTVENRRLAIEAAAASDTKSRFIAGVSHELRTPLNAVLGFTSMMRAKIYGPLGHPKYEEYVEAVEVSGQHLLGIINDILDISRIDSGIEDIREAEVTVGKLLESCRTLFRSQAEQSNIQLQIASAYEDVTLRVDSRLIRQILINLLSNALRHTPAGGKVSLTVRQHIHDGMLFIVSDSGSGMTEQQVSQLREPFGNIGNSWVAHGDGAGLGLPISHRFAALHSGSLTIESRLGEGTTCTLALPASRIVARAVGKSDAA